MSAAGAARTASWLLGLALTAVAQEPALVRSTVEASDPVWVGQRAPLYVELLVTTSFAGTPRFDLPEIDGAVLLRVGGNNSRPVLGSTRVGRDTYVSARYEFALFFQREGSFEVPGIDVQFGSSTGIGTPPAEHELTAEAHEVEVRRPPGTEDLALVVSAEDLEFRESWSPKPGEARVGDAFTRTITMSAQQLPGMLLPPLPLEQVEGVEVYRDDPSVQTATERGAFRGERVERVTYVCAQEGQVSVPALVLPWWDVSAGRLRRARLPSVEFEVLPAPVRAGESTDEDTLADAEASANENPRWWMAVAALLLVAFASTAWLGRSRIEAWSARRRWLRRESEQGRFAVLCEALRGEDPAAASGALYRWLDRFLEGATLATLEELEARYPSEDLVQALRALDAAPRSSSSFEGTRLIAALERVRREARRHDVDRAGAELPPLNPSRSGGGGR